jgi:hypothetical protein
VRADSPVRFVPAVSTPVPDEIRPQPTDREVKDTLASINKLLDAYFDFNAYRLRPTPSRRSPTRRRFSSST